MIRKAKAAELCDGMLLPMEVHWQHHSVHMPPLLWPVTGQLVDLRISLQFAHAALWLCATLAL